MRIIRQVEERAIQSPLKHNRTRFYAFLPSNRLKSADEETLNE